MREMFEKEHALQERKVTANEQVVEKIINPGSSSNPCLPLMGKDLLNGNWFAGAFNIDEPFGWKRGTVRAMLAIWFTTGFHIVLFWSVMSGANIIPLETYMYIVVVIVISYSVQRGIMKWNGKKNGY